MNYCSDHTRTYPVSGRFTAQQREIYDIVLACHDHIARIVRPGMMYMQEVHLEAYRKLAEGLVGVGLLKGSADDAVAAGAMYLFMPHGLGHGLGMDVHDCENIGERSFDYSLVAERAAQSATCLHRATWRLRPGTILSDEPGIYFIPALVDKCEAEGKFPRDRRLRPAAQPLSRFRRHPHRRRPAGDRHRLPHPRATVRSP